VPDDLEHERVPETEPAEHSSERDQQQEQGLEGRIIVRNLPARIDEAALRAHFGSVGEVTDARLIVRGGAKGSSGKATRGGRRFGFVGFGDAASAEAAIARFDRTFLGSARLAVARALPRDSAALPRPWSRHSAGSSAHERSHPAAAAAAAKGGGVPVVIEVAGSGSKENRGGSKAAMEAGTEAAPETEAAKRKRLKVERQQREFLSVMNHKRAETEGGTAFWANDDAALQQQKQRSEAPKPRDEDGNDDDEGWSRAWTYRRTDLSDLRLDDGSCVQMAEFLATAT
jgi:multiple RNA-binding domain-containing protein 1